MAKKVTLYEVLISNLNARDTDVFTAKKIEVGKDGFVKCIGNFKRKQREQVLLVPLSSIIYMEEYEVDADSVGKEKEAEGSEDDKV